jgi:hypothetical protein
MSQVTNENLVKIQALLKEQEGIRYQHESGVISEREASLKLAEQYLQLDMEVRTMLYHMLTHGIISSSVIYSLFENKVGTPDDEFMELDISPLSLVGLEVYQETNR